jgi:hypothetical protein
MVGKIGSLTVEILDEGKHLALHMGEHLFRGHPLEFPPAERRSLHGKELLFLFRFIPVFGRQPGSGKT